jgi:phosphopantetheine adenylyltransferase
VKEIKHLLEKYFQAESSLEEESRIKNYFLNNNLIETDIEEEKSLFIALHEEAKLGTNYDKASFLNASLDKGQKNSEQLLERYFNAESDLIEEELLMDLNVENQDPLFIALKEEQNLKSTMSKDKFLKLIDDQTNETKGTKVISLQKLLKYAAVLVLPLAVVFSMKFFKMSSSESQLAYQNAQIEEIQDPEQAYLMAKEALMFAGSQMKKGQKQLEETMPLFEKSKIFK